MAHRHALCSHEACVQYEACSGDLSSCQACQCGENEPSVDCLSPFVACSGVTTRTCGGE